MGELKWLAIALAIVMVAIVIGGYVDQCREYEAKPGQECAAKAHLERDGDRMVCRCPR